MKEEGLALAKNGQPDKYGYYYTETVESVYIKFKGRGKTKKKIYYFKGRLDGVHKEFSLTKSFGIAKLSDAKMKADELKKEAKSLAILGIGFSTTATIEQAFQDFQDIRIAADASKTKDASYFKNHVFQVIKPNRRMQSITTHDLNNLYKHLRTRNLSQSVMNDIKTILKELLRKHQTLDLFANAVKWESTAEIHESIIDVLEDLEVDLPKFVICMYKQFRALPIEYRVICQLSFECAIRIGQAIKITVDMVNLETGIVKTPKAITKTSVKHNFPISDEVVEDIKALIKINKLTDKDTISFTKYSQPFSRKYKKALMHCTKLPREELDYISTHSSRKLFVTLMTEELDYDTDLLDVLLSHKNERKSSKRNYNESHKRMGFVKDIFNDYWMLLRC